MTTYDCDFESAFGAMEAYPDDIAAWPEDARMCSLMARDRLMAQYPGRKVVVEKSFCIERAHERFGDNWRFSHLLVYQIRLDAPVQAVE